jgi:hypothetical protein
MDRPASLRAGLRREPSDVDRDWTLLAFVLLLVHGDAIHAFASGQRRKLRAHPQAEHEAPRKPHRP